METRHSADVVLNNKSLGRVNGDGGQGASSNCPLFLFARMRTTGVWCALRMRGPGSEASLRQAKDGVIPSRHHVAPPHARELVSDKPVCLCARYASPPRIVSALARYTYISLQDTEFPGPGPLATSLQTADADRPRRPRRGKTWRSNNMRGRRHRHESALQQWCEQPRLKPRKA